LGEKALEQESSTGAAIVVDCPATIFSRYDQQGCPLSRFDRRAGTAIDMHRAKRDRPAAEPLTGRLDEYPCTVTSGRRPPIFSPAAAKRRL